MRSRSPCAPSAEVETPREKAVSQDRPSVESPGFESRLERRAPADLEVLQQNIGNRAVQQLLTGRSPGAAPRVRLSAEGVRASAARGIRTAPSPMPYQDVIQRAFGRHDVSRVRAHVGKEASETADAMGALGYATGADVVFRGRPTLHTAAHEAAHVVQQRAGTHLAGGVGREGDRWESHADAVADRVVRGESAESLLDGMAGAGAGTGSAALQFVKVSVGGGEKEISALTESEMRELMTAQPMLTEEMEGEIEAWFKHCNLSHVKVRGLRVLFGTWKSGGEAPPKKEKKKKKRRRKDEAERRIKTYEHEDSASDLSDPEEDFDKLHASKPLSTTAAINRGHVPTREDELGKDVPITSMHHSDTFLLPMQGGWFVPRTLNGVPNVAAHRKKLPEKQLKELADKRDDEKATPEEREKAEADLQLMQRQLLFGNAIDWAEGEYDEKLVESHESHRKELRENDTSALGNLIRRNALRGMRSGAKDETDTDAEQRLLASKVWRGMIAKLMAALVAAHKDPFAAVLLPNAGIQLLLNRSSCLGCGKALALALVDFWKQVQQACGYKSWIAARDQFAAYKLFTIAFPVIYEYDDEKASNFANIKAILDGLQVAGWHVTAPVGIKSNPHADANHVRLREFLASAKKVSGAEDMSDDVRDEKEGGGGKAEKKEAKPAPAKSDSAPKPSSSRENAANPRAFLQRYFRIGHASGERNQCLLNAVYQLAHATEVEDAVAVQTMRDTLRSVKMADAHGMIDLYRGAGMQLANDLNIRIKAYQILGGRLIEHPLLGHGGPIVHLLHENLHFSPLWLLRADQLPYLPPAPAAAAPALDDRPEKRAKKESEEDKSGTSEMSVDAPSPAPARAAAKKKKKKKKRKGSYD